MPLFEIKPVDKKYYSERLQHFLPDKIYDIHTHVYMPRKPTKRVARGATWPSRVASSNPIEDLEETSRLMFPDKTYLPLIFGSASAGNIEEPNAYISKCSAEKGYPALMLSKPEMLPDELEKKVSAGGFQGIKVYLTFAPSYLSADEIRIFDFLPHKHLEVCDQHGWVVMLHIPRPKRLRDPVNIAQLLEIERMYKNLKLIVAHVGRAYCRSDIGDALDILSKTENMMFDISANTNSWVFEKLIKAVGSTRILFGSDFPITRMRMRRIEKDNIYVNLVPRGLYGDVSNDPHMEEIDSPESEYLSFFIYEEIEAFRQAAISTKLGNKDIENVFWNNAFNIFM
jgi:hypothetical protein